MQIRNSVVFLFILGFLSSCTSGNKEQQITSRVEHLPYYKDPYFTPQWIHGKEEALKGFHKIPPFEFLNQDSVLITEKMLEGNITVVDFFFTSCPGICSTMTKNMHMVEDSFLNDQKVLILSHSVTPIIDSVATLKNYAVAKKIRSKNWHLLTGDRDKIYDLGRNFYFIEEDLGITKKADEFLHTENFILLDGKRRIRGIYNGLQKGSVRQLIADIKSLKEETL